MIQKLRKFTALNSSQMRLFLEAYVTLGVMRAAILTVKFKRLVKSLDQQGQATAPPLDNSRLHTALAIGEAVRTAAGNTPWESACLVQALTAQRMLDKRGMGGVFHLGALMEDSEEKNIHAHAWLQCGDYTLTGEPGHERFAVLSTFSWSGKK